MSTDYEVIWQEICSNAGQAFETKTRLPFTYELDGDAILPSRTNYRISKNEIAKAFAQLPLDGPGDLNALIRGPAYVWAILHDKRIRGGE